MENTMRSPGTMAIDVSKRKFQEQRSSEQRHKEFLTNSIDTGCNFTEHRRKHTFQKGLKC